MLGLGFVRPPTRAELKVIFFVAALACFGFGGIAIVAGARAPAEKIALAHQAMFYGGGCVAFGILFLVSLLLLCWFSRQE